MQKQQQQKRGLLRAGLLTAGECERSGAGEALAGFQSRDISGCCPLQQHCICDKGKAAQRPSQTQQPKATENTGRFQRQSWEENHSMQTGISSVNHS